MHGDWLLAGDFNDIVSADEQKDGGAAPITKISKFVDRINSCGLIDVDSVGTKYTWRGPIFHDDNHIFKRLDRALCDDLWRLRFPHAQVRVLARVLYSDHHPLLICPKGIAQNRRNHRFRFESVWLTDETYLDMVSNAWRYDESLNHNLHSLEHLLVGWKQNTFAKVMNKKKRIDC